LVYAMRPPALDELGLVRALEQQALALRTPGGQPLRVTIEAGELPQLPAALEVAAYRIVIEALTNAARHSGGDEAAVHIGVDGGILRLEITDCGSARGPWQSGVGVSSMRERAAELGGQLVAGPTPAGGRVAATLPPG